MNKKNTIKYNKFQYNKQFFLLVDGNHGVVGPNNNIPVYRHRELNVIHVSACYYPDDFVEVNLIQGLQTSCIRHTTSVGLYSGWHYAVVKLECI